MLGFSCLVAGSFSLGGLVANEVAPAALNAVRFLIAGAIVLTIVLVREPAPKAAFQQAAQAPWRHGINGTLIAIYMVLMFEGLKTATPVSTAAVFTLSPLITAGFSYLMLGQVLPKRVALAIALGGVGALWVIFRADLAALVQFEVGRGEAIFFVGCAAYALHIPLLRKWNRGESAVMISFANLVAGSVLLLTLGAPAILATDWGSLPAIVWITILYTAIFATAGSFTLLQIASMRLPGAKVMAYTYVIPSWVILWELALGHGAPAGVVFIGVGITIAALLMLLRQD
ncbi:DMT family transporter [Halocynthiibacter sp. SDUM655004]|uniref:DMT family transporter n=2 Tax=Paracoccaceae TaxID=31989 RepID=A0AAE3J0E2_9RHOB|nr:MULTISPECIES: DMT family transporter [Halocynthiibacter]MCV6825445.1 DMT family transporter [Halocynthiibacter halioticoli]MCW4058446.1 DMT family transporter [Halocynthiibacter sp. SDUM655004]